MGDASYSEISSLAAQRIIIGHRAPWPAVIHGQKPNSPWPHLAGEAQSREWVLNAPCEVHIQRCGEKIRALLKERPLLRKENLEALVHEILRLVGFKLAEIR